MSTQAIENQKGDLPTVLAVDDEELNLDLVKLALKGQYSVTTASSGEQCLDMIVKLQPDIVLLDINMDGISGYEVCQRIKANPETAHIPVTFVSGLDSVDERIAGYDAGGDDYVTKPFSKEELLSKANIAMANLETRAKLKGEVSNAMETAMTALTSTGELGVVLNFLSESYKSNKLQELAEKLLEALASYGLHCLVQIRSSHEVINLAHGGQAKPLETALIEKLIDKGRIIDFDARSIINYPNLSILIKDMPLDDMDKYGRYKDNLALLVEGADARAQGIISEEYTKQQKETLESVMQETKKALQIINDRHQEHKLANTKIMNRLITSIEDAFISLDLTEAQEHSLLSIVSEAVEGNSALYDEGLELDQQFNQILGYLKQA